MARYLQRKNNNYYYYYPKGSNWKLQNEPDY